MTPERHFAETAYWFVHRRRYGSKRNAIKAVMRRKGMEHLDNKMATAGLDVALTILEATDEMIYQYLASLNKRSQPELTEEEFQTGTTQIERELAKTFPSREVTTSYMVAFLWDMPFYR